MGRQLIEIGYAARLAPLRLVVHGIPIVHEVQQERMSLKINHLYLNPRLFFIDFPEKSYINQMVTFSILDSPNCINLGLMRRVR